MVNSTKIGPWCEKNLKPLRGYSQLSTFSPAFKTYTRGERVNSNVHFLDIINVDRTFHYKTHFGKKMITTTNYKKG